MLGSAEEVTGGRRRRRSGSTAAAARSPVKEQVGLGNVLHTWLLGVLGEVLDESPSLENMRRYELGNGCSAAVAGARAPASRQPGQASLVENLTSMTIPP
jgi:hypothetical protein